MIKGAKKQIVVLRTGGSRYFDEAYFVLRRDIAHDADRTDILREANDILTESTLPLPTRKRHLLGRRAYFLVGSLCGALVAAVTVCLFFL